MRQGIKAGTGSIACACAPRAPNDSRITRYRVFGIHGIGADALANLTRLYWYTVEFGLIKQADGLRIYGSGIVSSKGESIHCLESAAPNRIGFDLMRIMRTRYRIDGKITHEFPMTLAEVARAEPLYEAQPGWHQDLSSARRFEDLPDAARRYVDRVEALVGVPIEILSIGPGRDETIVRSDPFRKR